MKKLGLLLLLWAGIFRLYGQDIAARLDSLVSSSALLQTSEVGISVFNLTKGEPVYAYQDRKLYRPASVEKVITSVTALARLGEAYTFDTRLAYTGTLDADSVLHGDLFLIGGFDPEFMEDDLDDLVGAVLRAGIRTVEGKLVADVSVMDSVYWGSGWAWDDAQYSFQPYLSPLMLNRGCVSVSVKPTQRGHRPEVETVPESDYYAIDNRAVCHIPHCGRLRIERDWMHNDNTIHITGNANRACGQLLSMFSSQDFFLHTFAYKLRQKHIGLDSLVHVARVKERIVVGSGTVECAEVIPFRSLAAGTHLIAIVSVGLQRTQTRHIVGSHTATRAENLTGSFYLQRVATQRIGQQQAGRAKHGVALPAHVARQFVGRAESKQYSVGRHRSGIGWFGTVAKPDVKPRINPPSQCQHHNGR